MSKKSSVEKNEARKALVKRFAAKRKALLEIANNDGLEMEERFEARLKLAEMPRNASPTRIRNRCEITGRPRGTFRQFGLARAKIRELAFNGDIPGVTKASW